MVVALAFFDFEDDKAVVAGFETFHQEEVDHSLT